MSVNFNYLSLKSVTVHYVYANINVPFKVLVLPTIFLASDTCKKSCNQCNGEGGGRGGGYYHEISSRSKTVSWETSSPLFFTEWECNVNVNFVSPRSTKGLKELVQKWPCIPGSNWNLEMLVFEERGKPENPEKNLSEQSREPTPNSTHIFRVVRESNPGHISGR